ncbi:MAG: iron-sulfur cluster assembly accessory protein [Bacteroidota bacterium]
MSAEDFDLDDVISSLIDSDEDTPTQETPSHERTGKPVKLTQRAANQVQHIISQENLEGELYLRVAVEGGGCSGLSYKLGLDYRTDDDIVFESHGVEVLVKEDHFIYVEGMEVDYPDGLDARGFTFENPQAAESCGCGTSFSI